MERSPVKHFTYDNDLYSLIVISIEGRTRWYVTHMDMTHGVTSHFGKLLGEGTAKDEADGWAQAEAFLKKHRPDKSPS